MKKSILATALALSFVISSSPALAQNPAPAKRMLVCRGPLILQTTIKFVNSPDGKSWFPDVASTIGFSPVAQPGGFGQNLQNGQCSFTAVGMTPADGYIIGSRMKTLPGEVNLVQTTQFGKTTFGIEVPEKVVANYSDGKTIVIDVIQTGYNGTWNVDTSTPHPIRLAN